jgi:hypothetical protein
MKRLILFVVVMLLTFASGVALDRLIWSRPSNDDPIEVSAPLEVTVVEPHHELFPTGLPAVTPVAASTSHLIFDYDLKRFDPYGSYSIVGKPDDLAEFSGIDVILSPDAEGRPSGAISVITNHGSKYESHDAVVAFVTERRLFFVAPQTSDSNYEYRFDGEFLRKNKAVLGGTLTKIHNGKKIVERKVRFSMVHLGC